MPSFEEAMEAFADNYAPSGDGMPWIKSLDEVQNLVIDVTGLKVEINDLRIYLESNSYKKDIGNEGISFYLYKAS